MRKALLTAATAVLLLLLPFALHWGYRRATALPQLITIATGPEGGVYRELAEGLKRDLEATHRTQVKLIATSGSRENLQRLNAGDVDFALTMAVPAKRDRAEKPSSRSPVTFVANAYSEVVHLVIRSDAQIKGVTDLKSRRIALGAPDSGNHAMAVVILEHCGLHESSVQAVFCSYPQMVEKLRDGTIDAAIITAGVRAPVLRELAQSDCCQVLSIPFARALAAEHLLLAEFPVPAGRYQSLPRAFPDVEIETVAVRAQLLTLRDVPDNLVKAVLATVLNAGFQQRNELKELSNGGRQFAQDAPQFDVHSGVQEYYNPEFRPLLNPDFVDTTEGMRSFLVSLLIAVYLCCRWWRERRERQEEHQLDVYIRALLDIENRQIDIDSVAARSQTEALENMLDEVTRLRQAALKDFSAHELKDDRAADCFLGMCHAISEKIGGKLLRQQITRGFTEGQSSLENRPSGDPGTVS